MNKLRYLISALVLLLSFYTVNAQEVTQIAGTDWLSGEVVRSASLSPDGQLIAAIVQDDLCIFTIESAAEECFAPPENLSLRAVRSSFEHTALVWSWDSQKIAFTEDFYMLMYESDLWVFDRSDGSFTNHTDDGYYGNAMSAGEAVDLDYLPAFGPDNELYFFRSNRQEDSQLLQLMRYDLETQTVETVINLSEALPPYSVFYQPRISLDGTQMTFPITGARLDDDRNGLWTVDLDSGELTQRVSLFQITDLMPGPEGWMTITQPVWTLEGDAIVFNLTSNALDRVANHGYVDLASGEISLLITPYETVTESYEAKNSVALGVGALDPAQNTFIYLERTNDSRVHLMQLDLPPGDHEAVLLADYEWNPTPYTSNALIGENGVTVLAGQVYQLVP